MEWRERHLLTEAARWKKEMAAGRLKNKSIEKLRENKIAKTPKELTAGIHKGTDNILAKDAPHVVEVDKDNVLRRITSGYVTAPSKGIFDFLRKEPTRGKSTLNVNRTGVDINHNSFHDTLNFLDHMNQIDSAVYGSGAKKKPALYNKEDEFQLANALTRRHEALEGKYQKQLQDKYDKNRPPILGTTNHTTDLGFGMPAGAHQTYNVLNDEAKLVNSMSHTLASKSFKLNRKRSKESKQLKEKYGIGYNDITGENTNKLKKKIEKYEEKTYKERQNEPFMKKLLRSFQQNKGIYTNRIEKGTPQEAVANFGVPINRMIQLAGLGYLGKQAYDLISDQT